MLQPALAAVLKLARFWTEWFAQLAQIPFS